MFDLTGKTALVTGATGGIGGEIARSLHAAGAHVVLSGTRTEALAALAGELQGRVSTVTANLSDPASVDGLIAAAVVYLASNEAAYVTGSTLHVNGGMAMI